jgi:hypothetical protein
MPVTLNLTEHDKLPLIVPRREAARNSGALSLEPFEMFGLNFQVPIECIETGSTGDRKKE